MKKFYLFFISIIFCFLMISCSNLYQDLTSTTVELTPEFISHVRNTTTGDNNYIFAKLTCGRKTITKKIDISEQTAANGAVLTFDNLIVGKKGSVYIAVANDKTVEDFKSEIIASIEGTTEFTVQPNNQTKIKVTLNPATKYTAYFTTFTETDNGTTENCPYITFTEYSTITAPLPVGTTRWRIRETSIQGYPVQLIGSFGEKIDVKNELMKYREKFFEIDENDIQVNFEATGNPMNQIKTPIVYSSFDSTSDSDYPYLYNFANSLDEVGENTESHLNLESEIKDYCFDNAGNLYVVYNDSVYKIAYDNKEDKYENFIDENGDLIYQPFDSEELNSVQSLAYDAGKNVLYVLTESYLYYYPNPAGRIYKNSGGCQSTISLDEDANIDFTSWTVHDGIIYVSTVDNSDDDKYKLVLKRYKYENGVLSKDGDDISKELGISSYNETSTDLIYQDGSIYIIFKSYNRSWTTDSNGVSIGGILKYNIENNSFDKSFGIKGLINEKKTIAVGNPASKISYLAPTDDNEDFYFYGPTKFVAIMPKKLVFLDSGADISSYDADNTDNKSYIPSKSRIVEYDLSTNTFSSKEITGTDLCFSFSVPSF